MKRDDANNFGARTAYVSITVLVVSEPVRWELGCLVMNVNTDIKIKRETLKNEQNELYIIIPGRKVYKKDKKGFTGRIYFSSLTRRIKILIYLKNL